MPRTTHPAPGTDDANPPPERPVQPPEGQADSYGRRGVVMRGTAAVLGATGLATVTGCGPGSRGGVPGGSSAALSAASPRGPSNSPVASTSSAGVPASAGAQPGGRLASTLAKLSDIPVGGAHTVSGPDGTPVVIAQPEAGLVLAFSARCTHQGCTVTLHDTHLHCPCHGSMFDAMSGKVLKGPARAPLAAVPVTTRGDHVVSA